jgi:hypothetical protein
MATKPHLKQDPLVDKLRPDPSQPPSIERRGFLGRSDKAGYWRLYLTRALTDYVEIAEDDIVHQESLSTANNPDAGSRVWIKETAILMFGPPTQVSARNLDGAISCSSLEDSWGSLPGWRIIEPSVDLETLLMLPVLPWAIAARFFCVSLGMLEGLIRSQSRMRRFPASSSSWKRIEVGSDAHRCGRDIVLGPGEYKTIHTGALR